jgi:hypothetical protein
MLGDDKRQTRMVPFENNSKQRSLDEVRLRQNTRRQNSVDQFVLCQAFGLRCCLQVLVRDMKVAVPQVIADCELTFAHLRQHGSNRVPKCVQPNSKVKPERFPLKVTSSHRLSQGLLGWNPRLSRRSPLVRSPSLRHSDSTVKLQLEEFPLGSSSGLSWTFQLTSQFRSSFFAATTSSRSA